MRGDQPQIHANERRCRESLDHLSAGALRSRACTAGRGIQRLRRLLFVARPGPHRLALTEGAHVAFATSLLFLQLRIADEFKDFEDDSRYRPYPVPRAGDAPGAGLAGGGGRVDPIALALWLEPSIVWLLIITWAYLAVMTREFFVPRWLKAHPVIYMASHMVILPLIDIRDGVRLVGGGYRQPPRPVLVPHRQFLQRCGRGNRPQDPGA